MIKKILSLWARLKNTGRWQSINFPYQYKVIDFGRIPNPLVKLQLKTAEGIYLKVKFLVDSGADATTLPLDPYGELVGFEPKEKERTIIGGIGSKGVEGYPGKIEIKLSGKKLKARCYFIKSPVIPLLGRCDFWDKFSICFDNQKKEVVFRPI